jgi:hypothetical protein
MPRAVAAGALLGGLSVVCFGAALLFVDSIPDAEAPRLPLEPVGPSASFGPRAAIHGIVRTPADDPVRDAPVALVPLFESEGAERMRTHTDSAGRFAFEDVEVNPGSPYAVDVDFDGATFSSAMLRGGWAESDPLRIVVAPTTSRPDDLVWDVESIAVIGDAEGLQAVHAITVRNRGERAYVGPLRLPLLPGANAIDPRTGLDRRKLTVGGGELVSRTPIVPGRHDITYTYIVTMSQRGVAFRYRNRFPVARLELLAGGDLEVRHADGFDESNTVHLGPRGEERTYRRYTSRRVPAGELVGATIVAAEPSPLPRTMGLVAAAAIALVIVAFPLIRRRRTGRADPTSRAPEARETLTTLEP